MSLKKTGTKLEFGLSLFEEDILSSDVELLLIIDLRFFTS